MGVGEVMYNVTHSFHAVNNANDFNNVNSVNNINNIKPIREGGLGKEKESFGKWEGLLGFCESLQPQS